MNTVNHYASVGPHGVSGADVSDTSNVSNSGSSLPAGAGYSAYHVNTPNDWFSSLGLLSQTKLTPDQGAFPATADIQQIAAAILAPITHAEP